MANSTLNVAKTQKPLARSITVGCVAFIVLLGVVLGIVTHIVYRHSLYQRYRSYVTDILHYVDRHIDNDDLHSCINSLTRSEKFTEPEIHTRNEVESLSFAVKQMSEDMRDYVSGIIDAESHAKQMTELANRDALTGIRNKTAYDTEIKK